MARQKNNHLMRGTRGMFGKQVVFKMRNDEQILAAPPNFKEDRLFSEKQLNHQKRFKMSTRYANEVIKDSVLKAAYQLAASKKQSAQNVAFRDAYYPPEILSVVTKAYTGNIGNIIVIHAVDDFKVASVNVAIHDSLGNIVERGDATTDENAMLWIYTASATNASVQGGVIKVSAFDLPMNETVKEVRL
jgi:hypothetical protein